MIWEGDTLVREGECVGRGGDLKKYDVTYNKNEDGIKDHTVYNAIFARQLSILK